MPDRINPYASPETELGMPAKTPVSDEAFLRLVGWGLSFILWGMAILGISVLVIMSSLIFTSSGMERVGHILMIVAQLGMLAGGAMWLLGPFVCLAVPSETEARPYLICSILLQLLDCTSAVVSLLAPDCVPPLTRMLSLGSMVFFVFFIQSVSEYIGRFDLRARGKQILMYLGVGIPFVIYVFVMIAVLGRIPVIMAIIGLALVATAWGAYISWMNDLRKALTRIGSHTRRGNNLAWLANLTSNRSTDVPPLE